MLPMFIATSSSIQEEENYMDAVANQTCSRSNSMARAIISPINRLSAILFEQNWSYCLQEVSPQSFEG
jgi:hypothetical protein